jgi:membrane protease YdiL (CAAX protease family)
MVGSWINSATQRLVVALGDDERRGPKLGLVRFLVVGFVLFTVFMGCVSYLFPQWYSDTDVMICGGEAVFCVVAQLEYRPRASQFGLHTGRVWSGTVLKWVAVGIMLTASVLGLIYGSGYILMSTSPPYHGFTAGLQPLSHILRHPLDFLLSVAVGPVLEELLFRGHLYLVLRQNWGRRWAALVTSLVFAVLHPVNVLLAVIIFFTSLIWIYMDNKAKSLAPSIAAHVSYNLVLNVIRFTLT